jgi:hypothetical protein
VAVGVDVVVHSNGSKSAILVFNSWRSVLVGESRRLKRADQHKDSGGQDGHSTRSSGSRSQRLKKQEHFPVI